MEKYHSHKRGESETRKMSAIFDEAFSSFVTLHAVDAVRWICDERWGGEQACGHIRKVLVTHWDLAANQRITRREGNHSRTLVVRLPRISSYRAARHP